MQHINTEARRLDNFRANNAITYHSYVFDSAAIVRNSGVDYLYDRNLNALQYSLCVAMKMPRAYQPESLVAYGS